MNQNQSGQAGKTAPTEEASSSAGRRSGYVILLLITWCISMGLWYQSMIKEEERYYLRKQQKRLSSSHVTSTANASSVLLFSAMDDQFQTTFADYIDINQKYCNVHGYPFVYGMQNLGLVDMDRKLTDPHFNRIYAALNLLKGRSKYSGPPVDWIVYIDTDAFISEPEIPLSVPIRLAEEYFSHVVPKDRLPCQFIAQDHRNLVSSGFWILRNSTWSIQFIERWLKEAERLQSDQGIWAKEQGPLMHSILRVSSFC